MVSEDAVLDRVIENAQRGKVHCTRAIPIKCAIHEEQRNWLGTVVLQIVVAILEIGIDEAEHVATKYANALNAMLALAMYPRAEDEAPAVVMANSPASRSGRSSGRVSYLAANTCSSGISTVAEIKYLGRKAVCIENAVVEAIGRSIAKIMGVAYAKRANSLNELNILPLVDIAKLSTA